MAKTATGGTRHTHGFMQDMEKRRMYAFQAEDITLGAQHGFLGGALDAR